MRLDDFFDLIHRFYDRGADLFTLVRRERGQQAVRRGGAAADADRQMVGTRIVEEAFAGNFHDEILAAEAQWHRGWLAADASTAV